MNIFQLILYSLQVPHESRMKDLLTAHLQTKHPDISFVFYCFDPALETLQYSPDLHLLRFPGSEEYKIGILLKTVLAVQWVLHHFPDTDYVVRSNISTFVQWPSLKAALAARPWTYTGPYYHPRSGVDLQAGFTPEKAQTFGTVPFVSGTCIVLSRAVAAFVAANKDVLTGEIAVVDDLALGILMNSPKFAALRRQHGIDRWRLDIPMDRWNRTLSINDSTYRPHVLAYRNKRANRDDDVQAIQLLAET